MDAANHDIMVSVDASGRMNEVSPDLLHDLDAAFSTDRAPFCGTLF
jgi:hypothetical protein